MNVGVYGVDSMHAGYARVATDGVTLGWLCDVYIAREVRGRGLGTALSKVSVDAIRPLGLTRLMLSTADAREAYAKAGLTPVPERQRLMAPGTEAQTF